MTDTSFFPWVVVSPDGVQWLGLAMNEADAWRIALGWPDEAEIAAKKAEKWFAASATVSWKEP